MGLFDKLFGKKEVIPEAAPIVPKVKKPRVKKEKPVEPVLSEKDRATAAGEPYISVLKVDVDPANIHSGSFDLDWNEIFIAKLVKAGYMKKKEDTDQDIVDRWWTQICRQVVLELYDQEIADPENRDLRKMTTKDLGNGRTEVS